VRDADIYAIKLCISYLPFRCGVEQFCVSFGLFFSFCLEVLSYLFVFVLNDCVSYDCVRST